MKDYNNIRKNAPVITEPYIAFRLDSIVRNGQGTVGIGHGILYASNGIRVNGVVHGTKVAILTLKF